MGARIVALLSLALSWGCGGETGILITVTADDQTIGAPLTELRFTVGVQDANDPTLFVADPFDVADDMVDITGRDLVGDPYKLLLRDARSSDGPSTIMVAAIGYAGQQPIAFAALSSPATFIHDRVLEYQLELVGGQQGTDFDVFDTGCVTWPTGSIAGANDLDCDGCDDTTGTGARCGDCVDGDLDGYGVGPDCLGPDCDDTDNQIADSGARSCYTGPDGTSGVGVCRSGTETCSDGVWSPCTGEITPSGEACNGEDDDCDTSVDEALGQLSCGVGQCVTTVPACSGGVLTDVTSCTPLTPAADDSVCDGLDGDCDGLVDEDCANNGCALVSPTGNDTTALADNNATPFATIQAAINWASADTALRTVCVSSGASCGLSATYSGAVVMANGVHVFGGYDDLRNRCGNSIVVINPGTSEGVKFPSSVQQTTILDGVRINRQAASDTAGVTVEGAKGVVINRVQIANQVTAQVSYGVNLVSGAEALITESDIWGGNGSVLTVGVRSKDSRPIIRDNCEAFDNRGRCAQWCQNVNNSAIRGRPVDGSGDVYAVWLDNSPGAVIEYSAVCGNSGATGSALRITGNATGTVVRGSFVSGFGGINDSYGIWMDGCADSAPWIVDNHSILGEGRTGAARVNGIRAIGKCHPVIERNLRILGGNEGGTVGTIGIYCGQNGSGDASRCAVLDNPLIQGSVVGFPPFSIGVRCDDGGCARISGNTITGRGGVDVTGLWLGNTGTMVDNNVIRGGCAETTAVGVRATDSFARLENNRIFAGNCPQTTTSASFAGLMAVVGSSANQLDVHSNDIDGDGNGATCTGAGVVLSSALAAPAGGSGTYRNNIILPGACAVAVGVAESDASADPRIFEHNDLVSRNSSTLYVDEVTTFLATIAEVNALTDTVSSGNISADPMFVSYPADLHLGSGSMCVGAGTPTGAPPVDMDGETRDPTAPDIGADEL